MRQGKRQWAVAAAVLVVAATAARGGTIFDPDPPPPARSVDRVGFAQPTLPDLKAVLFQPDVEPPVASGPVPAPPPPQPPPSLGQQPLVLPPVPNPTPSQTNTNQLNQLFLFENTPDLCAAGEGYLTGDVRYFKLPGSNGLYRYQLQGQYGVTDQVAVGATVPVVTADTVLNNRDRINRTGLGDILIYGQYKFDQLVNPDVVDLTVQVDLVLPTGNRAERRDTGTFGVRPLLLAYKDFGRQGVGDLGLYGLFGTTLSSDIDVRLGVAATYDVDRFVGILELTDTAGVHLGRPQFDVTPGLAYRGFGPLVLDIGVPIGLNNGSPDWGVVFKATYAFEN